MNTIGWLFILAAGIALSSISRGRVLNIGEDMGDAFLAIVRGDSDALGEVLTRKGDGNVPTAADIEVVADEGGSKVDPSFVGPVRADSTQLAKVTINLGSKAKGYRWTATGPDYYDCSGLMWKACLAAGLYRGGRFTTYDFARRATDFHRVPDRQVNDVVLWSGHMGVVTGPNQFYSARSTATGIGYAAIDSWDSERPTYYRAGKK